MNIEHTKVLIEHLESPRNPIGWDMASFFDHNEVSVVEGTLVCKTVAEHSCGTAACIAGHAAWLAWSRGDIDPEKSSDIEKTARVWLDLELKETQNLFYGRWSLAPLPYITLRAAVAHLKGLAAAG